MQSECFILHLVALGAVHILLYFKVEEFFRKFVKKVKKISFLISLEIL